MCFSAVQIISAELRSSKHWELTGEGTEIAGQGSQEARVFTSIPLEGLAQSELMVSGQMDHRGSDTYRCKHICSENSFSIIQQASYEA